MAKEGIPFVLIGFVLSLITYWFSPLAATPFLLFTAFSLYFFRDPERNPPSDPKALVSPADGTVLSIEEIQDEKFLYRPCRKISIFMSPFNVHVNRAPADGKVTKVEYRPGKYAMAMRDKASDDNERNAVFFECDGSGSEVVFVQIAGFVARRIVCYVKGGERLQKGQRYGMIRFGSRMEVFLPLEAEVLVKKSEQVTAGETILAKL